ncbi:MAG: type secretion system protein, partial [Verrucomicrobia bacterium]|nr:type secretion system protein [Verrucomicrobiota bacterium]
MLTTKNRSFPDRLRQLPGFAGVAELPSLQARHGVTVELVQALIDEKLLPKDEACRAWADSLGFAYVDIFASVVTDEAVAKIPVDVAKKINVLGLYLIDGTMTAAMADP